MRQLRSHLTYSNVMSTIAVFGVLAGGTAWAASKIDSKEIRNGAVTAKKLHKNAVTAKKIKNGAVNSAKIANGQVRAGDLGPLTFRESQETQITPGEYEIIDAECYDGGRPIALVWRVYVYG